MASAGTLGARLYCSTSALTDIDLSADDISDFQALVINSELGLVESFNEIGKAFSNANFQAVDAGRMYKLKGGFDNGSFQIVIGQDLSDPGQALLYSYANSSDQNTYPFKLILVGTDVDFDTVFFGAKVMSFKTQMGNVNSVIRATIVLNVNTEIFTGTEVHVVSPLTLGPDLLTLGPDQLVL